jgi:hypothetical protein
MTFYKIQDFKLYLYVFYSLSFGLEKFRTQACKTLKNIRVFFIFFRIKEII